MFKRLLPVLVFPLILVGAGCAPEQVIEMNTEVQEVVEESGTLMTDGTYELVAEESVITWEASKKLVDVTHNGTVNVSTGRVVVEGGQITGGTVTVDMATIIDLDQVGEMKAKLEGHLMSEDFFDVVNYPAATFTISGVDGDMVTGVMTIKGIDGEVTFEAEIEEEEMGVSLEGTLELDRSVWDVRYGSESFFDNLGDAVINDIFYLGFDLEFWAEGTDRISEEAAEEISEIIEDVEDAMAEDGEVVSDAMIVPGELTGGDSDMVVGDVADSETDSEEGVQ
ncbi:MAG: YceI family protein [Parcubacteria group bacterium]|nr:YceI family protein [Parcubacteria group bacterium]